jgi:hypothetical protein
MKKKMIFASCFIGLFFLTNCGNSKSNEDLEKEKIAIEKAKLELEKEKLNKGTNQSSGDAEKSESKKDETSQESNEEVDEKKREKLASKASKANRFQDYTDAVVVVKKTYFYSMPDEGTKKSSFLIEGDRITVEKSQRNYVYVTYTNSYSGKTTTGWLKSDDLEPIDSPEFYD